MFALLSRTRSALRSFLKRKEVLADRQVLSVYAPQSLLFPFCAYAIRHSCFALDLFAGLIERDQKGRFFGDLAESWVATEDKKIWRFTLRLEALWSNGEAIVAEDFVRSIKFLLEHKLLSPTRCERLGHKFPLQHLQAVIAGTVSADKLAVYAEDERTVRFHLTDAMEETLLLAAVSDLAFFPIYHGYLDASHLPFLLQSDTRSIQGKALITTGPFVLSKQKIRNGAILEKNPLYWNHRNILLERLIYYFALPDDLNKIDLFQFHFAYLSDFPRWFDQFRENLHLFTSYRPFLMFFNTKDPRLSSKNVRKAIQHLVVFEQNEYYPYLSLEPFLPQELLKVMQFEKRMNPHLTLPAGERLKKARAFLEKEGFSEENPLSLTISHAETYSQPTFKDMLLNRFKPIPFIHVTFQFLEREALAEKVRLAHEFQLFCDKWQMPAESPLWTLLTQAGTQAQQFTGFEHKRYTELCHQLLGDPCMDRQANLYRELFEILHEEVPYLVLGYGFLAFYHQSHVGGIASDTAPKQSLILVPKHKRLYRLQKPQLRPSRQKQRLFEAMLTDGVRCPV